MTRELAIEILKDEDEKQGHFKGFSMYSEALEMAISALSTEGDLISRQAVLDELEKWDWQDLYLPIHFKQILDDVPSVENKGEWIWQTEDIYKCSECGEDIHVKEVMNEPQYVCCPMCGARMKGGE